MNDSIHVVKCLLLLCELMQTSNRIRMAELAFRYPATYLPDPDHSEHKPIPPQEYADEAGSLVNSNQRALDNLGDNLRSLGVDLYDP